VFANGEPPEKVVVTAEPVPVKVSFAAWTCMIAPPEVYTMTGDETVAPLLEPLIVPLTVIAIKVPSPVAVMDEVFDRFVPPIGAPRLLPVPPMVMEPPEGKTVMGLPLKVTAFPEPVTVMFEK